MTALLALWATYLLFFKPQILALIVGILLVIYLCVIALVVLWIFLGLAVLILLVYLGGKAR